MTFTVRELAEAVRGEVVGDGDLVIHAAAPLHEAKDGDITFVEHEKYLTRWHASTAAAAVVSRDFPVNGKTVIRVQEPLPAFIMVVEKLHPRKESSVLGIHPSAVVHPSAKLGPDVSIGPHAVIGEGCEIGARCTILTGVVIGDQCRLGDDVRLHPNVVLYSYTVVGNRVTIHANSVIGADGFGYRTQQGRHAKIPQLGCVLIEDDVEIGSCTTIDRATFGATRIGTGTKIDNLVMIGHNCQIGRNNLIVGQVGIAGSSSTGDYVVLAGQVGIADHVHIGDRSLVGAQSGVTKDLPGDQRFWGSPARPEQAYKRTLAALEKISELRRILRQLQDALGLTDNDKEAPG